jgi:hypothetical protein
MPKINYEAEYQMSRAASHLAAKRASQREASIDAVMKCLEGRVGDDYTLKDIAKATGLSERTLRRDHVLPLIETALKRSFRSSTAGGDPRTVQRLQRELADAIRRIGKRNEAIVHLREVVARRDGRIKELQTMVDLLSKRVRDEIEPQSDGAEITDRAAALHEARGNVR